MTKAEEIFRSFFVIDDYYHRFKAQHTVISQPDDDWSPRGSMLATVDETNHFKVYEDKPSLVQVCHGGIGGWYAVLWWDSPDARTRHRDQGPAVVYIGDKGDTLNIWYRNGEVVHEERIKQRAGRSGRAFFRGVLLD